MIAFDAISFGQAAPGTSITFNHTVSSSSDRLLLAHLSGQDFTVNSITYNGVAMSLLVQGATGAANRSAWYGLVAPASGTNSFTTSISSSLFIRAHVISYTGVSQTGLPDATNHSDVGGTSPKASTVTTIADNAFAILGASQYDGFTLSASTNVTRRDASDVVYNLIGEYGPKTPAGGVAQTVTWTSGGTNCRVLQVSIAPSLGSGGFLGLF